VIVGDIVDVNANATHSFVRVGGSITVFDPPGAIESIAEGINKRGEVVGTWTDQFLLSHGYIRTATAVSDHP
jgi:hypothetical protein